MVVHLSTTWINLCDCVTGLLTGILPDYVLIFDKTETLPGRAAFSAISVISQHSQPASPAHIINIIMASKHTPFHPSGSGSLENCL